MSLEQEIGKIFSNLLPEGKKRGLGESYEGMLKSAFDDLNSELFQNGYSEELERFAANIQ